MDSVVGANVRAEMARRSVSQVAIAAELGLSQAAVSARLRGVTAWRFAELLAIAGLLDVDVAVLTEGSAA